MSTIRKLCSRAGAETLQRCASPVQSQNPFRTVTRTFPRWPLAQALILQSNSWDEDSCLHWHQKLLQKRTSRLHSSFTTEWSSHHEVLLFQSFSLP